MRSVVVGLVLCVSAPAGVLAGPDLLPVQKVQAARSPHADCSCRAQGRMFAYGERVCLRTPDGPRMAQCAMSTNVTNWALTAEPCPDS
ncbi:hypothetical protein [Microvirga antarctica]|uniref:hypothetical protein n=1 Tax=Microvirga antarctica TaxID=2819233 RepID=UPI001B303FD4|nr:hypothetical protein [Microvirga antarctica]